MKADEYSCVRNLGVGGPALGGSWDHDDLPKVVEGRLLAPTFGRMLQMPRQLVLAIELNLVTRLDIF